MDIGGWVNLAELTSREMNATRRLNLVTELNRVLENRAHESQVCRSGHTPQD
jgi:hypothetical protein